MNNYLTNITTQVKLKSIKIDPKMSQKNVINTFQNDENFCT